jgi:general stress protein 26
MDELKKTIEGILKPTQLMSLATLTEDGKPWVRYVMGRAQNGISIQIATFRSSRKVRQIQQNSDVHINCGVSEPEKANGYLQIAGTARVSDSDEDRKKLWHDGLKVYFEGPDDPQYCVVIVEPYRIEYMAPGAMKPEIWTK